MFDVTERVRASLYLLDSDDVNSHMSPPLHCYLFLFSEIDEEIKELVRKCEELYDMSNEEYTDNVWEEKFWGQTVEELKKNQLTFNVKFY